MHLIQAVNVIGLVITYAPAFLADSTNRLSECDRGIKRHHPSQANLFQIFTRSNYEKKWLDFICPKATIFDPRQCKCVQSERVKIDAQYKYVTNNDDYQNTEEDSISSKGKGFDINRKYAGDAVADYDREQRTDLWRNRDKNSYGNEQKGYEQKGNEQKGYNRWKGATSGRDNEEASTNGDQYLGSDSDQEMVSYQDQNRRNSRGRGKAMYSSDVVNQMRDQQVGSGRDDRMLSISDDRMTIDTDDNVGRRDQRVGSDNYDRMGSRMFDQRNLDTGDRMGSRRDNRADSERDYRMGSNGDDSSFDTVDRMGSRRDELGSSDRDSRMGSGRNDLGSSDRDSRMGSRRNDLGSSDRDSRMGSRRDEPDSSDRDYRMGSRRDQRTGLGKGDTWGTGRNQRTSQDTYYEMDSDRGSKSYQRMDVDRSDENLSNRKGGIVLNRNDGKGRGNDYGQRSDKWQGMGKVRDQRLNSRGQNRKGYRSQRWDSREDRDSTTKEYSLTRPLSLLDMERSGTQQSLMENGGEQSYKNRDADSSQSGVMDSDEVATEESEEDSSTEEEPDCYLHREDLDDPSHFERWADGKWQSEDCNWPFYTGLVWSQDSCRCEWGPNRTVATLNLKDSVPAACLMMLKVTFNKGDIVDEGRRIWLNIKQKHLAEAMEDSTAVGGWAGSFRGASISVPYFKSNVLGATFHIGFRFKLCPGDPDIDIPLIHNDCAESNGGPTIMVTYQSWKEQITVSMRTENSMMLVSEYCSVDRSENPWTQLDIRYDDNYLEVTADGVVCVESDEFYGPMATNNCPLTMLGEAFCGSLDEVVVTRGCTEEHAVS